MAKIKDSLQEFNPWWKGEFKIDFKPREIHEELSKFISLPQIIALTGLRRVGKTTLMLKVIEDSIKEGFDPGSIIYFSFDEFKDVEIREVIKEYEELTEKDFKKGKYLLFLDEIQKLNNWENQLKSIYDLFGKNVKAIISGSESLFIRKNSRAVLAGRIFEFKVEQLSFKEFLGFKNLEIKPIGLYEKELAKLFQEFVFTMGFPELVGKEKEVIRKYVQEGIIERIIYRDIPELLKIRDISILKSLFKIFAENPGQITELSELAKELGISRQTLSNYLIYLEESFLLRKLYNFSRSARKTERKLKKYYPTIISPDLLFKDDDLSKSKVFEWFMVNQLKAEFFWRDSYKNEVDIVLIKDQKPFPIEVKFGKLDFDGLKAFAKKFNINEGHIISSAIEQKHETDGRTFYAVPAFKFLLK